MNNPVTLPLLNHPLATDPHAPLSLSHTHTRPQTKQSPMEPGENNSFARLKQVIDKAKGSTPTAAEVVALVNACIDEGVGRATLQQVVIRMVKCDKVVHAAVYQAVVARRDFAWKSSPMSATIRKPHALMTLVVRRDHVLIELFKELDEERTKLTQADMPVWFHAFPLDPEIITKLKRLGLLSAETLSLAMLSQCLVRHGLLHAQTLWELFPARAPGVSPEAIVEFMETALAPAHSPPAPEKPPQTDARILDARTRFVALALALYPKDVLQTTLLRMRTATNSYDNAQKAIDAFAEV